MTLQMPITKRRISNHFHYGTWKYILLIVLVLFGWNLIYTMTRYQPPESMRVEFYVEGATASDEALAQLTASIHDEIMPEMELVEATTFILDEQYGDMMLTVWISASQGDVYMLSADNFERYAASGAFVDLQSVVDDHTLMVDPDTLQGGYVKETDSGETKLYGIPADLLTGFWDLGINPENKVLCILFNSGNEEYSVKFLNYLVNHLQSESQ